MKLKTLSAIVLALSAVPAGANTCGIHDHLCRAHGLGAAHGSVNRDRNAPTGAVIYMQKTDTNAPNTDVDNHVLGAATDKNGRSNGSFNPTYTDYGARNPSRLAEWDTPDTKNRHIYGSAYANQFNNGQALAVHTGDFDGGENGKIPNATGCPTVLGSSKQNCEAVIITGNMPSGIYSQKAEMFNYHGVANPKADLTMGAYATGNMALISRSHAATSNGVAVGKAGNRVEHHTTLSGHGAKTQQYDYEFVNRGHKGHGAGTTTHNHLHNPARTHEPLRVTTEKLLVNTGKHEIPNFARHDAEQARNSLTVPDDPRVTVKRQPSPMLPETQQGHKKTGSAPVSMPVGVDAARNPTDNIPNLTDSQVIQQAKEWLLDKMPENGKRTRNFGQNNTDYQPTKSRSDDEFVIKNTNQDIRTNNTEQNGFLLDTPEETCREYGIGCDNVVSSNKPPKIESINTEQPKNTNSNREVVQGKQNIKCDSSVKGMYCTLSKYVFLESNGDNNPTKQVKMLPAGKFATTGYATICIKRDKQKKCIKKDIFDHTGIDLQAENKYFSHGKRFDLSLNQLPKIRALIGGKVVIPEDNKHGMVGIVTEIDGQTVQINYLHMLGLDEFSIKNGDIIEKGTVLGRQGGKGDDGNWTWSGHLHMEFISLKNQNEFMSKPLPFLKEYQFEKNNVLNPKELIDYIDKNYNNLN